MLRVWRMSGEQLAAISIDEISNVRDVKDYLSRNFGFPVFLQQLLDNGSSLDDSALMPVPIDLQLVLKSVFSATDQQEAATELLRACATGHFNTVRLLLEAGTNKDAQDRMSRTGLILAAKSGHVETVRLLLEAASNVNAKGVDGCGALMVAAHIDNVEITQLLLDAGANKDLQDLVGNTALLVAARLGNVKVVELLLEAGCKKDLPDRMGNTGAVQ